ncbi:DNA-3-methyladenine glycosylase I [Erwinia psidii]|uniref:DNA-3-methyladenine glycosylase I n=1 Tax=Erwinia psidii TaxID=69224 RepID=A0A3N6S2B0_9GAMM|nr:DNA-3-methyladenine glycosylase I [Erwinia psidii]MCX8957474.1 DNA-3-methyladenine glycosylase I [Erwinia psidii]MCX8960527.1 DNA-3-methyladenine glycosylase I [Erwinia psidii]MCX8964228.1 DNA-3-methyladenine glycosylase I [Erwinia psidii]RQM39704.1 DNA-3-methyladenine glycosylase I [Erwinia psidii]
MDGLNIAGLIISEEGLPCCDWRSAMPGYHDHEWGRPVVDDRRLFEKVCLEGFHSGMSWQLIYHKRERFRRAFCEFDFYTVARFTGEDVARLMADKTIVRNRAKIRSVINNAQRAIELVAEAGSLAAWFWQFEPAKQERPATVDLAWWQTTKTSSAAIRMSTALKKRGWTWVGPVTCYSLMQALGLVNDHLTGCHCREACEAERATLFRPV